MEQMKETIESLGFKNVESKCETAWIYRFICSKRNEIELFVYTNDRILIVNCLKNKVVFDGCIKDKDTLSKILRNIK